MKTDSVDAEMDGQIDDSPQKRARRAPQPVPGSRLGKPNRVGATVKEAVMRSFREVGEWRYLMRMAEEQPKSYMHLLGRCVPQEVAGHVAANLTVLVQQLGASTGPVRGVLASPVQADVYEAKPACLPLEKTANPEESKT